MRILIDTNVLISAFLFPSSVSTMALLSVLKNHTIVLCSYVISELKRVVSTKFKGREANIDLFLSGFNYEFVYTPENIPLGKAKIRDPNDYPILYTAIIEDVDVILTGDLDFKAIDIERPLIMTPKELLDYDELKNK